MKKTISLILAFVLMLSCVAVGVDAAAPEQEHIEGYNYYCHYPINIIMAGLPKTIKAQFDYDRDFIDIVPDYHDPDYPDEESMFSYNGIGFVFPLATEEYGAMYDVGYTVDDTVITFTYTLKSGYTLDDYLDILDADNAEHGRDPVSREDGELHMFHIFDIAMKEKVVVMAKIVDAKLLDVIADDGTVLYENGEQKGTVHLQYLQMPLPNLDYVPVDDPDPTEGLSGKYLDKLLGQYSLSLSKLTEYDEFYEHKDSSGEVDWALVRAATEKRTSTLYTNPTYFEFCNRVLEIKDSGKPFAFDVGVYSAEHDCFFGLSSPEVLELDGIEQVWTEIGEGRLIGDMDGDDSLEIIDAALIQQCQAGLRDYPADDLNIPIDYAENYIGYFSDFDQDGERNITDATAVQRYLAGLKYHPADWTPYPHKPKPDYSFPTQADAQQPTSPLPTRPAATQAPATQPATEIQPTEPAPAEPPTEKPTEPETDIPQITGFRSIGKGVEIHLSTVRGAEKYRVYYKNSKGEWTKMGETDGGTFIDDDVKVGSTYRYTVRCIKADLSAFTSDFDHTGWTYTYDPHLETPQITRMEAESKGVRVTWDAVDGADLYRIYYQGPYGGGMQKLADVRDTSYLHIDAEYGCIYYYVRCLSCKSRDFASDYQRGPQFLYNRAPTVTDMIPRANSMEIHVYKTDYNAVVRLYRKDSSGWKRIGEQDYNGDAIRNSYYTFYDEDVEPGKSYTYTARCINLKTNCFTSPYDTSGWTQEYSVGYYVPEFEFVIYTGDNMMLLQAKENKFGLDRYRLDIVDDEYGEGSGVINGEPNYIRATGVEECRNFKLYLTGIDENGNRISAEDTKGRYVFMTPAPYDLKVEKKGDRRYRFSWQSGHYVLGGNLNLISGDGEYMIDSDYLESSSGAFSYTVDLSDYPEDVQWSCIVWSCSSDGVCCSMPISIEFCEADYK